MDFTKDLLHQKGLDDSDRAQLSSLLTQLDNGNHYSLGYPVSKDFDYSELAEFFKYPINNIGDPYEHGTYTVESHDIEREVVGFFADLFRADPSDYWGYVTNGGSESNLYGLYLARELHPKGMVYYSESTHYSVQKNLHLLNMPSIVIRSQENGEMDYEDLRQTLQMNRHKPAIILANIGTTMTEAKDDVKRIKEILRSMAIKNHYIHSDAALAGSFAPFLDPRPNFDFADGADSIAISGHKFVGSPIPCGVVVVKRSNRDRIARGISYIGGSDTTISGSRNGHSPLFLWYAIKTLGHEGFRERLQRGQKVAAYTEKRLKELGIPAWRNSNALTVVFPMPSMHIQRKWQLATAEGISHIICMPNVSTEQIDALVEDLKGSLN